MDKGYLSMTKVVELMSHNPAKLFHVAKRGFLREGYKADIAIVRRTTPWQVTKDIIQSKCGWSPLEGTTFNWQVEHTICNGHHIYNKGIFDDESRGEQLFFRE